METKRRPIYVLPTEAHFRPRDTNRLKVKGRKKIFHEKGNQKKAGVTILISDKMDFKIKNIRQRRALHNDQRINPRRRHNNYKYICTQHVRQMLTSMKGEIHKNSGRL